MQSRFLLRAFAVVLALWGGPVVWAYVAQTDESGVYVIKWHSSPVEMEVKLSSATNLIDGGSQRSAVITAAEVWNAQLGTVRISAQASAPGAYAVGNKKSEIVMDSTVDGEAFPSGALAITMSYARGNDMAESDIVFNTAYTWNSYRGALRRDCEDIRRVAMHELGHVLGLDHPDEHGQYVTALMDSHVSAIETLQPDDIRGVQSLYGAPGVVPANDSFVNASAVDVNQLWVRASGSNVGASHEGAESAHAGSAGVHSVWWKFTPPENGNLVITTMGSNFDTVLAVYVGANVSSLAEVASNNDEETREQNSTPQRKQTSRVEFKVTNGTSYFVAVDGWGDDVGVRSGCTGTIELEFTFVPLMPPVLISQPRDSSAVAGKTVQFGVSATGKPVPSYRWQRLVRGGTWTDLVEGGSFLYTTTAFLHVSTIFSMDGDQFRCVVSNPAGTVISDAATLHVTSIALPVITAQPETGTLLPGVDGGLTVEAANATGYQWYRDGELLAGETESVLFLPDPQPSDAGSYHVVVSNPGGAITSATARLALATPPVITNESPVRQIVAQGGQVSFRVSAAGVGALNYQWFHNGKPIVGATTRDYSRVVNAATDAGAFWVAVSDSAGTRYGAPFFAVYARPRTNVVVFDSRLNDGMAAVPIPLDDAISVCGGGTAAYALRLGGTIQSWGQRGPAGLSPTGLNDVVAIAAGTYCMAALKADGMVVGTGEIANPPAGLKEVWSIACGDNYAVALKTDGSVRSWGYFPRIPSGVGRVQAIAAGSYHALTLGSGGTVKAWELYSTMPQPILPAGLSGVVAITPVLALKSDGTVVYCSGGAEVPPHVRDVVAIASAGHFLALKSDGTVVRWGDFWYVPDTVPSGLRRVFAIAAMQSTSLVLREVAPDDGPLIVTQPMSASEGVGWAVTLQISTTGHLGPPSYRWQRNGRDIGGASTSAYHMDRLQPAGAGVYTVVVNSGGAVTSEPAVIGVLTQAKVNGAGRELTPTDIHHPNGKVFDQILLNGDAAAVTADHALNQMTRTSFIDLDGDIVQVEFSGPGTLSLVLDGSSGPTAPANYHQPGVEYVKGHAGIVIAGADERTNVSVFTVGRATAFDPTGVYDITKSINATNDPAKNGSPLFHGHATTDYDGIADIAFIAILSANGKFGGVRTANANYFASQGYTGIYAPGVEFTGPVYLGDLSAFDTAKPVIVLGAASDVRVTGGDLLQSNRQPVQVSGITQLRFADGSDSHGNALRAQPNQAIFQRDGIDVTAQIVVNP